MIMRLLRGRHILFRKLSCFSFLLSFFFLIVGFGLCASAANFSVSNFSALDSDTDFFVTAAEEVLFFAICFFPYSA